MKKLFTLIASALFAVGASAQIDNPTPVKVTWALTDGTTNSVVSPSAAGTGALTVGEGLEILEASKPFNDINFMAFQAVGDDKGDNKYDKAVELNKYIDLTVTPSDLYTMTKVTFDIVKVGTGDPQIFIDVIDGEGHVTHLKDGAAIDIRRNDDSESLDIAHSYDLTIDASSKPATVRIYVGKMANNKQVGLANVVIEGTIKGDNIEAGDGEDDNTGSGDGNTGDNAGDNEGKGELIASWYFNNWSETTVAALKADAALGTETGWSDDEKGNGSGMDATADNCFWAADESVANEDGYLTANGVLLEELEGLKFAFFNRNLAIAVNYPETSIGEYHGPAYLWLGGSGKEYFTIPNVPAGSVITIGVESHKNIGDDADARGITLSNAGDNPKAPITYEEQVWKVPAGEAAVDVVVTNTNGCHLYFIEIAEGTADDDNTGEGEGNGEGDTTGIQQVAAKSGNSVIINLAGQKVDSSYKGIVVKDGKKYVQK